MKISRLKSFDNFSTLCDKGVSNEVTSKDNYNSESLKSSLDSNLDFDLN